MVARRQGRDIWAKVTPSDQPVAIQKKREVTRHAATVSDDGKAIPISRCGAGILSDAPAALRPPSSSMDFRRVRHSSESRTTARRSRANLTRRVFPMSAARWRRRAHRSWRRSLSGLESISAIIVKAFSRPARSNLPSDRRKSSSSLSSGRRKASGAAATIPVPLCFGIWIRHIEDEPRTTADRQPLPPGRGVPSRLWFPSFFPVAVASKSSCVLAIHPSIRLRRGRPHVNRKNNVTDNRRADDCEADLLGAGNDNIEGVYRSVDERQSCKKHGIARQQANITTRCAIWETDEGTPGDQDDRAGKKYRFVHKIRDHEDRCTTADDCANSRYADFDEIAPDRG